jgi:tetratricopeptide (TPR) repeat protein
VARRATSKGLLLLALAGALGWWPLLPPWLLLVLLLWLPGASALEALRGLGMAGNRVAGDAPELALLMAGPGRLCLEVALSLLLLAAGNLPVPLLGLSWQLSPLLLALLLLPVSIGGLLRGRGAWLELGDGERAAMRRAWLAAGLAVLALLPVVLAHAGATVDDWWDIARLRSWLSGAGGFAEPFFDSGFVHPRFTWNAWLAVQALVAGVTGGDPVALQAGPLAVCCCVMAVSGVACLATALFGRRVELPLALLLVPVWLYGTEALPFFKRLYQDKFVAGLALGPATLALSWIYLRRPSSLAALLLFACALATACVHGLVYALTCFGVLALIVASWSNGGSRALVACLPALVLALGLPLVFPLWQGLSLGPVFKAQGISMLAPDNPVVAAHARLGRLLWIESGWTVVNPAAVFGPPALLALPGLWLAWRRKHQPAFAALLALSLLPALLLFVPGLSALAGRVLVPWMLYRVGWLVPVCLLAALLPAQILRWPGGARARVAGLVALSVVALSLSAPVAADRLRRDMHAHPWPRVDKPRGAAQQVYRFLAGAKGRSVVMAPLGFSELLPALSGKPVVAATERCTLVFSRNAAEAYRRLKDSTEFYLPTTSAGRREQIALNYQAGYVVVPRRLVAAGSENPWLRRTSASSYIAMKATAADRALGEFPRQWTRVLENRDYLVFATGDATEEADGRQIAGGGEDLSSWRKFLELDPDPGPDPAEQAGLQPGSDNTPGGQTVAGLFDERRLLLRANPPSLSSGKTDSPNWRGAVSAWEYSPAWVELSLELPEDCLVSGVEIVPLQDSDSRQVFELSSEGHSTRRQALDGQPIALSLEPRRRTRVDLRLAGLLGSSPALSDLRVTGDPESCRPRRAELPRVEPGTGELLELAWSFPRNARAGLGLSRRLADEGRTGDARAVLAAAVAADPGLASAWVEYGLMLDQQGDFDSAVVAFRRALEGDSNHAWAHGCLSWALFRRGNLPASVYHSARALRLDEGYADAWTLLGMALRSAGARSLAESSLRRAVEEDPARAWGVLELARLLEDDGRRAEAVQLLDEFVRREPGESKAARLLRSRLQAGAAVPG